MPGQERLNDPAFDLPVARVDVRRQHPRAVNRPLVLFGGLNQAREEPVQPFLVRLGGIHHRAVIPGTTGDTRIPVQEDHGFGEGLRSREPPDNSPAEQRAA